MSDDITINLDGQPVTLVCSLAALKQINQLGGILSVTRGLDNFDFQTYVTIVAAGLNTDRRADIEEKVYRTGMRDIQSAFGQFCINISNGGRDPTKQAAGGGERKGEG